MLGNGRPRALNFTEVERATVDIECDAGGEYGRGVGDSKGDPRGLYQGNRAQSALKIGGQRIENAETGSAISGIREWCSSGSTGAVSSSCASAC